MHVDLVGSHKLWRFLFRERGEVLYHIYIYEKEGLECRT